MYGVRELMMAAAITAAAAVSAQGSETGHRRISGVYPHLCTYTIEPGENRTLDECGIGAVVPWAGKLWMITYGAHYPHGSSHKLYSIDEDLNLTIHPGKIRGHNTSIDKMGKRLQSPGVARLARLVVPGLPHHITQPHQITQRGNRRQQTFFREDDYAAHVELMARWCGEEGVEVWAYCLMPNHVHLFAVPQSEHALARAIVATAGQLVGVGLRRAANTRAFQATTAYAAGFVGGAAGARTGVYLGRPRRQRWIQYVARCVQRT